MIPVGRPVGPAAALAASLGLFVFAAAEEGPGSVEGRPGSIALRETIRLFNGRDLSGWTTWLADSGRRDPREVFTVADGMIRISGDGFGYLATEDAHWEDSIAMRGIGNFLPASGTSASG